MGRTEVCKGGGSVRDMSDLYLYLTNSNGCSLRVLVDRAGIFGNPILPS